MIPKLLTKKPLLTAGLNTTAASTATGAAAVQKRICHEQKENYLAFGDRVGWRVKGKRISYPKPWKV